MCLSLSSERLSRLLSLGNLFEAGLWMVFAAIFITLAIRCSQRRRRLSIILAAAFAAFALSDVIESQTGAWWRPLWLLVFKGGCIVVFCYAVWEYRRIQFAERAGQPAPVSGDGTLVVPENQHPE
jgi:hypothetical protein